MIFRKKFVAFLIGSMFYFFFPALVHAQQQSSLSHHADSLYQAYDEQQALKAYNRILKKDSSNYKALWRSSFLYSRISDHQELDDPSYYKNALKRARKALHIDSAGSRANYAMAVALGRKALDSGAKERVKASRDIRKYAIRSIRYDSTYSGGWYLLGRWNYEVANLSWIQRAAVNALFGGLPDASNKQAVKYIKKAISLDDRFVLYYYNLAKAYKELGNDTKAISYCQQAQSVTKLVPHDQKLKKNCQKLIKDLR